ncbi:MAG: SpoIID/LytB domain-containing protein, partial [Planctomycetes bacterium]|nr:SpoIID/LytB domain-containing protein [Planctomycetota bacterium]
PAPPPPPAPLPEDDPASVDVLLRAAGARATLSLSFDGPGRVEEAAGPRILRAGDGLTLRLERGGAGMLLGGEAAGTRPLRAVGARGQGFLLDGRPYPGELLLSLPAGGGPGLHLVNRVSLDDYLAGVLAGELFPDAPPESMRTLCILARSFALSHLAGLTDDPGLHQAYRGRPSPAALAATEAAVASTRGLRLVGAGGDPLPGYWYHSTCGGRTADASLVFGCAPHPSYAGVACDRCTASKYYSWEAEVPEADLRRAVRFGSAVAEAALGRRGPDGRVEALVVTAAGGTVKSIPTLQVRAALGPNVLRSTLLSSVEPVGKAGAPTAFRFRGRGWGHGVGLCQVGAMAMAREGRTAEQILAFYYPGTRIASRAR